MFAKVVLVQRSLFDQPAARRADPPTSHEAAELAVAFANTDRTAIVGVLAASDGLTAGEISRQLGAGWDNVRVSRRMKELERGGLVRRGEPRHCADKGTLMITWWHGGSNDEATDRAGES